MITAENESHEGEVVNFTYKLADDIQVIKKDGTKETFNIDKVICAINKSASRVMHTFTDAEIGMVCNYVNRKVKESGKKEININDIHNIVEAALDVVNPDVAKNYRDYRNYKQDFVRMLDKVYQESQKIMYIGDRDNANADSTLVSTKRSLIFNALNKELYKKFFLTKAELQAARDGYIYIHDMSARLNSTNCCLLNVAKILEGGFEMGNVWYTEPKTLDVAFDVISDVVMSAAAQQYGGLTVPEVDKILEKYAQKSYDKYLEKYSKICKTQEIAEQQAMEDLERDFEQGFQGWEMKWNTVGSSRGDYPFISTSFGLADTKFGIMANKAILKTRMNGQGAEGHKKPVLFPKLIFLYDEAVHGEGGKLEETFNAAIECSKKAMYPDYVSLSGPNYVSQMYQKYGRTISPMGCRSFLSPWFERGGFKPADENDKPVFCGRGNCGVISLNLPMIYMQAKQENRDFFEVLDYYLELIRNLHKRTVAYLGEMKASTNPLAYCQGGFLGGNLKPDDKIKPVLKAFTTSFGITALHELQVLYNGKSIAEDGAFALEVMQYIAKRVDEFKEADGILHSCYGTPAESLCKTQVEQFRLKYGIIENVSDREYMTNSFHCHVSEDISPIEKQDLEGRFIDLCKGGQIFFTRFYNNYNTEAFKSIVRRGMKKGFYEGTNLNLSYCEECGAEFLDGDVCPKCGSTAVTQINRVCGYLGYRTVNGKTRFNDGKYAETNDRVSY